MITEKDFDDLMVTYPFIERFSPHLSDMLQRDAWHVHIANGRTIYDVGGHCCSLLFLLSGSFNVMCYQGTRQIQLYSVQPGDCCMLSIGCLMSNNPHVACAFVESDLTAIAISQELFLLLHHESLDFRNFILSRFAAGLSMLLILIRELAFKRIDQRLAALLLAKGDTIPITHHRLAEELGSVREVVSRYLKNFETQGILRLDRGQILILDRTALEKIANVVGDESH